MTRLALTGPQGRRRIRVSGGRDRPVGELDAAYERAVEEDARRLVESLVEAGAEVRGGGASLRP